MRDIEKKRATSLAWYYRNRELSIARNKEWGETNLEKRKAHQKTFRSKHKQWCHDYQQLYRYGLTPEQWYSMFESQGCCCANARCKRTESGTKKGWHTDHNVALGKVNDSLDKLLGLIDYLNDRGYYRKDF